METSTDICWSTKEPFKFLKPKSPQIDSEDAESDTKCIKSLPYTGLCALPKRRGAKLKLKQKEKKQNSNTSLHSSSEKLPQNDGPLRPPTPPNRPPTPPKRPPTPPKSPPTPPKSPPTPPKASPTREKPPQIPQNTKSPVSIEVDSTSKPPKAKRVKKMKPLKKPPSSISCSCNLDSKVEKKKSDKDSKPKCCTACFLDNCECYRPKHKKVKGKRTKPGAPMCVLKENAKTNCCACCCLLADYFREVYRLITLKNDSRIAQILCEIYDVAGCLCNDCIVFLKKILGVKG